MVEFYSEVQYILLTVDYNSVKERVREGGDVDIFIFFMFEM